MSYRRTKEELDAEFENFLKESVSDDSVDLTDKQPITRGSQKSSQKLTVSWWQDDEHSSGAESSKRRFIKAEKAPNKNNEAVSSESHHKPVPKPRSKAPDSPVWSDKITKAQALDISQNLERDRASSKSQSSPTHEARQQGAEWSLDEAEGLPGVDPDGALQGQIDALPRSGKPFRKSLKSSQPIQEEEDMGSSGLRDDRGSSENKQSLTAAGNMSGVGLDTLEEEEEKARFFAQIEAGASSAVDYSKLNRELESTHSTFATELGTEADRAAEPRSEEQSEAGAAGSPAHPGSPHYSEDFEDEESRIEPLGENSKISPILARVSLYDSLEETGRQNRKNDVAGSLDRGVPILLASTVYEQSGGSEVEALQEAYRQIQSVVDSDDHRGFSLEDRGKTNQRSSSPSPRQRTQQSLQPVSTHESDLPTAEELMRPIRPEHNQNRGFTLEPVSDADHQQCLKKTFLVTPSEMEMKQLGETGTSPGLKEIRHNRSPEPPNSDPIPRIRKEVERLMQEQNNLPSQILSQAGDAKKPAVFRGSSTFSERKPTSTTSRGKPGNGKPAGNLRSPKTNKAAATPRTPPPKTKMTKKQQQDDAAAESGVKASSELVASVQSLVAVLQQQIHTSSHHDTVREVRGHQGCGPSQPAPQTIEDNSELEVLRLQQAQTEKELQMMKNEAEKVIALRQQNYVLQSKLRSAEEASQKRRRVDAADPSTDDKFQQVDKEIKEQELLIKGYQQENEKLYLQMKVQQAKSKANEEAMFNENQRLLNDLAFTREQLKRISRPVGIVCSMDHTKRISELLAQISSLQSKETKLSEENHRLKQHKQSLEVEVELLKKERDLAKVPTISISGNKGSDQHSQEVAALKKKLQWFAENQELLDRDASRLKAATAEIFQLKEQVENLKQEVGKRSREQQRKSRDRSADINRMRDLQRQVKELERILTNRNPNSLPALIYAAASAGGVTAGTRTSPPNRVNALLERRIQRLESELESHDEESKRTLRGMEQQFHRLKLRYEQQIYELEQQLERQQPTEAAAAGSDSLRSKCQILEEELNRVQDSHREKERFLQDQIESLQPQQLKNKDQPSPGRHQRQAEAAFGARIERLNQELATKTCSIRELSRTVERLQKERRSALSASWRRSESKPRCSDTKPEGETFPPAQYEKSYQPTVFTGSHISEVLHENEALRQRVELLQLQTEQEEEKLKAHAVQAQEELYRLKESFAEQLSSVKAENLRVLDRQRAAHALEHSSSKVAELSNKLSSQEMEIKHLRQQLKEQQECKEALSVSRIREEALQEQLARLLLELKEAREAQSSEVKLLCSLEKKIVSMELRQEHREKKLQQAVAESFQTSAADLQSEVDRWRRLAQDKSRELVAFRSELDSILDILRHLQKQGVVLPTPDPGITARPPLDQF